MDLYALPPEDFTAARDAAVARARTDRDRDRATALRALRRPTAAAYVVNRLVRARPDALEGLAELAGALRQAQADGTGEVLRALTGQRRQVVAALTEAAVEAAGRPVASTVRDEVAATFDAALADPASADAVASGRLVRALAYAGLGEGLDGAVAPAVPAAGPPAAPRRDRAGPKPGAAGGDARLARAHELARERAGALDDAVGLAERAAQDERLAVERAERAAQAAAGAEAGEQQADAQVQGALEALQAAREQLDRARAEREGALRDEQDAASAVEQARARSRAARERVAAAQQAAEQARTALAELPGTGGG